MINRGEWLQIVTDYWYLKEPENKQLEDYIRRLLELEENSLLN